MSLPRGEFTQSEFTRKLTSGNGPKLGLRLEPVLASRKLTRRKLTRKFTSPGHSFRSAGGAWNDGIPLKIIENLAKYMVLAPQATWNNINPSRIIGNPCQKACFGSAGHHKMTKPPSKHWKRLRKAWFGLDREPWNDPNPFKPLENVAECMIPAPQEPWNDPEWGAWWPKKIYLENIY